MKSISEKVASWPPKQREEYRNLVNRIMNDYSMSKETAEKRAYDSMMAELYNRKMCHDR